jgi:hypothetical protein
VGILRLEQLPYELGVWPESGHVGLEQQSTLLWNNCPLEQPSVNPLLPLLAAAAGFLLELEMRRRSSSCLQRLQPAKQRQLVFSHVITFIKDHAHFLLRQLNFVNTRFGANALRV